MKTSHASSSATRAAAALAKLKKTIARRMAAEFQNVLSPALIHRAIDDAHELANSTGFPLLTFPLLAEENVRRVSAFLSRERDEERTLDQAAA